jgi:hypothetical protein
MLRILLNSQQLCDGLTRSDLLHVGGLSLAGGEEAVAELVDGRVTIGKYNPLGSSLAIP